MTWACQPSQVLDPPEFKHACILLVKPTLLLIRRINFSRNGVDADTPTEPGWRLLVNVGLLACMLSHKCI